MPLTIPNLSDKKYQDFLSEALARIPVHNPEWTNFNDSDPGVTIIQLFAFLAENLLYRSNRIPEVNRRKFLSLLGIPLHAATPAHGVVALANDRGQSVTTTLAANQEVRAGQIPYRTELGLDVLPVEGRVFYKRAVGEPPAGLLDLYQQLYMSFGRPGAVPTFNLFETVPLVGPGGGLNPRGVRLGQDTVDGALWIALLKRTADRDLTLDDVRAAIEMKTVSLGLLPLLSDTPPMLTSVTTGGSMAAAQLLRFEIPAGGSLLETDNREPRYRALDTTTTATDGLGGPSIVQLTLPGRDLLTLWDNIEPLEPGVGNLPPPLDDLDDRLITWIRVRLDSGAAAQAGQSNFGLVWAGINATTVCQRAHVEAEPLATGTGQPDQVVTLSHAPVVAGSVKLSVTTAAATEPWAEIDDLLAAGPEVPPSDPRIPVGVSTASATLLPCKVFVLNPESGELHFGDGLRGCRPPFNATLRVEYDFSVGRAGNVGVGAINAGPTLPAGFSVSNPLPTWGGTDSENVSEGEKQIPRYLQHRDRLVTVDDFATITRRTPGVEIGRVEVLPAFNPDLVPNEPGDAPGAVTVMVIPKYDANQPDAPMPDRVFLNTICQYLDPRRLVTTEVFLRGPAYKKIWISVGIRVDPGASVATVRESVKQALLRLVSPLPGSDADQAALAALTLESSPPPGWPLSADVIRLQLQAVASRVAGVFLVNGVLLAEDSNVQELQSVEQVRMTGLELPRIVGISVATDAPLALSDLRDRTVGRGVVSGTTPPVVPLPVPAIPQECH
jgi:hypothetical protein